jgi:hypothetical protein
MFNKFFPENRAVYDMCKKWARTIQDTDNNILRRRKYVISLPETWARMQTHTSNINTYYVTSTYL